MSYCERMDYAIVKIYEDEVSGVKSRDKPTYEIAKHHQNAPRRERLALSRQEYPALACERASLLVYAFHRKFLRFIVTVKTV